MWNTVLYQMGSMLGSVGLETRKNEDQSDAKGDPDDDANDEAHFFCSECNNLLGAVVKVETWILMVKFVEQLGWGRVARTNMH